MNADTFPFVMSDLSLKHYSNIKFDVVRRETKMYSK